MADINLSDGRVWFVEDYDGPEFDKRLNWQDVERINRTTPYARRQENVDIEYPYLGIVPDYGLTGALPEGTVMSRDRIDVEYEDGRIRDRPTGIRERLRNIFSSDDEESFERVAPKHFKQNFRRKYQRFDDTSVVFADSSNGAFVRNPGRPRDLYNSMTDVMVIAHKDSVDESYEIMLDLREEVEDDLQRLANQYL